jgi:hypothetical protein
MIGKLETGVSRELPRNECRENLLIKLVEIGKRRLGENLLDLAVAKDARLSTASTLCRTSLEDTAGLVTGRVHELEAATVEAETHCRMYEH